VPWVLVGIYVAGAPQVPGFVYAITATQFVLFFSFALNLVFRGLCSERERLPRVVLGKVPAAAMG
jgi:hypothetical protein